MKTKKRNMVDVFGVMLLLGIALTLLITTAQAYSYNDYYGYDDDRENNLDEEQGDDELEYYDYSTGRWKTIPEPDPYYPAVSYGHHHGRTPISTMMPLFIFFFVFLLWLAYAVGCDED